MDIVFNYFLNAFNNSINLFYFFCLMFCCELVKMLPFFKYDSEFKSYFFTFKNIHHYYNFKWIVLIIGVVLGVTFYFVELSQNTVDVKINGFIILRIFLTFSITLTLYDYFFQLVIQKSKQIMSVLIKASINPVVIDVNSMPGVDTNNKIDSEPPL